jgi:hypothetical protein
MNVQYVNPIYDSVFKYLMSDSRVAKFLLSTVIGEQIVELSFSAKEHVRKVDIDKDKIDRTLEQLVVCRFDFEAKIKTETGTYKTVLIELQKAKRDTDIMRFRRYLGTMYQDEENTYDEERIKARQIYCVYFLNYGIGLPDVPVLKVDYSIWDLATGEKIERKSEFVDSLNHLSWIVQVQHLKERRRNEVEQALSIFDQSKISGSRHILEIDESQYPEEFRALIIRKLIEASASRQVREDMQLEDDVINELLRKDALYAVAQAEKEAAQAEKEAALTREAAAQAEKEAAQAENERLKAMLKQAGINTNITTQI